MTDVERRFQVDDPIIAVRSIRVHPTDAWEPPYTIPAGTRGRISFVRNYVYPFPYNAEFGPWETGVYEGDITPADDPDAPPPPSRRAQPYQTFLGEGT